MASRKRIRVAETRDSSDNKSARGRAGIVLYRSFGSRIRNGFVVPGTIKIKNSRLVPPSCPPRRGCESEWCTLPEAESFTAVRDNDIPPYRYLVHLSERYIHARANARTYARVCVQRSIAPCTRTYTQQFALFPRSGAAEPSA